MKSKKEINNRYASAVSIENDLMIHFEKIRGELESIQKEIEVLRWVLGKDKPEGVKI